MKLHHAEEFIRQKPELTLRDIISAIEVYSPEYMHGLPKRDYLVFLESLIRKKSPSV